jgi:diguanylate cyclase (GGDEF)-like protein
LCDLPEGSVRPGMTLAEVCALRVAAGSFPCQPIDSYLASIDSIVGAGYAKEWTAELANGRVFSMHVQPLPGQGWVMTCEDITRRREDEAKILYLARHDVLTGLANRALFEERLHAAVALARRGAGFAVLCLDLDRFKAVNDTYGHPVGDSLLRAVADRLCAAVRDTDTVARLGGDEFAVILFGTAEAAIAASLASRIVESISRTFELDGHQLHVGTSVGIALAGHDDANPVQMMKDADRALYLAKQDGRGTWRFSDPAVGASAAAG